MSTEGFASSGLIDRIDQCTTEITLDMQSLVGRKVEVDDGYKLINALYYLRADIDGAIQQIEDVLNEHAVCS